MGFVILIILYVPKMWFSDGESFLSFAVITHWSVNVIQMRSSRDMQQELRVIMNFLAPEAICKSFSKTRGGDEETTGIGISKTENDPLQSFQKL